MTEKLSGSEEPTLLGTIWFVVREIISWILFLILLIAMFSFVGCSSYSMPLEHRWEPITSVQQTVLCPSSRMFVLGDTVYVNSLANFKRNNQEKIRLEANLIHEQVHARRQRTHHLGTFGWTIRYVFSTSFAREEEEIALRREMAYLRNHNVVYDPEHLTKFLDTYHVLTGKVWDNQQMDELIDELVVELSR